jgi:beta-galactosidase
MNLGVQYYRPPFPVDRYWEEDFRQIKESGLDTVQLWVVWAWVEPKPGQFQFDDYDRLVELAGRRGLNVVLSTLAEVHPYWIHRAVPGSEMIDHMGRQVISSNRNEIHFGITPGGCFDHPGVWERMQGFLSQVVTRYRSAPNLAGWDAWNELRWNVQADGLVCFCPHTIEAFRRWLSERFGGLEELNAAWLRRYGSWEDVFPGKLPDRPYTELMAWLNFLTWRANRHGKGRYDLMKGLDPTRPVTVHGGSPSPLHAGVPERYFYALDRGNDWFYADDLDGVGTSSFPIWENIDDAGFGMRVEFVRSAARGKRVWLSEVQGGRSAVGFNAYRPVDAFSQQRWIWNGLACGAEKILFWCWRNEVFGRESGGFGIAGDDGLAGERLAAMRASAGVIEEHAHLLENYRPAGPQIGVLFSPQTYYLAWAQENTARRPSIALQGYARALVRQSIPYVVVEEEHLEVLEGLKLLFLPHVLVTSEKTERALEEFVRKGGTLVCESECGAFNPAGLYRYPEDRFTARLAGIREMGRRNLEENEIELTLDGRSLRLSLAQWLTPVERSDGSPWDRERGAVLADGKDGALLVDVPVGQGRLILCGTYLGESFFEAWNPDFERFVAWACRSAGWEPEVSLHETQGAFAPDQKSFVYTKFGASGDRSVVFVFFPEGCDPAVLRFRKGFFRRPEVEEILSGRRLRLEEDERGQAVNVSPQHWRIAVLAG